MSLFKDTVMVGKGAIEALPTLILELLPVGLVGIMIAAMLAVLMIFLRFCPRASP